MSWIELHSKSEQLAIEAGSAYLARDYVKAVTLYRSAADFERQALTSLDPTKSRTRGITAVSAVALLFKGKDFGAAEQLAYLMLSDANIPEFARTELRNLVQAIWTESAKQEAGVTFLPGHVMVSVKGGEVVTGGAPLDLIVEKVQTIQSMFYRTIEHSKAAPHRRAGRPPKDIQEACRPWLFQSPPGSYQFSVAIQKPAQADFFNDEIEPEEIARKFLEIVSAAADSNTEALKQLVPDEAYRSTFLKLARNLAPAGGAFDSIEFRSAGETRPISLTATSKDNIKQQIRLQAPKPPAEGIPVELRGILRAVHLDKDWIDILVDGSPVHIEEVKDAVDDVIGPMINRPVIVKTIKIGNKHQYVDIELADQ